MPLLLPHLYQPINTGSDRRQEDVEETQNEAQTHQTLISKKKEEEEEEEILDLDDEDQGNQTYPLEKEEEEEGSRRSSADQSCQALLEGIVLSNNYPDKPPREYITTSFSNAMI